MKSIFRVVQTVLFTLMVNVAHAATILAGEPPAPSTTFTTVYNCGNTVVTRNTDPSNLYYWYWQTSASGTSTTLGSGASITITASNSYFLRARLKASPY